MATVGTTVPINAPTVAADPVTKRGRPLGMPRNVFTSINIAPDGNSIVFNGNGKGGSDLYRYTFATRKVTPLVQTDAMELSPDGTLLAYAVCKENSVKEGGGTSQLLRLLDLKTGKTRPLTTNLDRWDDTPGFSADGKQVVFNGMSRDSDYDGDAWLVDVDGDKVRQVTKERYMIRMTPIFWRDEKSILLTAFKNKKKEKSCLATVPSAGGVPKLITPVEANSSSATVVDTHTLLLISDLDGNRAHKVCLLDTDSKKFDILADVPTSPSSPVLSGRTVYWLQGHGELMRINLDTRKIERVEDDTLLEFPERYYQ